jgi:hypothetical protein
MSFCQTLLNQGRFMQCKPGRAGMMAGNTHAAAAASYCCLHAVRNMFVQTTPLFTLKMKGPNVLADAGKLQELHLLLLLY